MEGGMARPGSGAGGGGALRRRIQSPGLGVEAKNKDAIQTLVRHHHEPARGIEQDLVWMRAGLFDAVRSRLAGPARLSAAAD